jgi:hypothetical protein
VVIDGVQRVLRPRHLVDHDASRRCHVLQEGWLGSHEFQSGFLAMPRSIYTKNVHFLNDGFIRRAAEMVDPANAAAGTIPSRGSTFSGI